MSVDHLHVNGPLSERPFKLLQRLAKSGVQASVTILIEGEEPSFPAH
jgi:hypothetical protein